MEYVDNNKEISIHAPSRERPQGFSPSAGRIDFNPRSLTGATTVGSGGAGGSGISIHAPSRERRFATKLSSISLRFQSTLPHGSDSKISFRQENVTQKISIHAPSRERPRPSMVLSTCSCNFNPRSLTGATASEEQEEPAQEKFQSTLPHGSDNC